MILADRPGYMTRYGSERAERTGWQTETHYQDTGCEVSDRCQECPLPKCRYDMNPVEFEKAKKLQKDFKVMAWWDQEEERLGRTVKADEVAEAWGIRPRTVWRIKRRLLDALTETSGGSSADAVVLLAKTPVNSGRTSGKHTGRPGSPAIARRNAEIRRLAAEGYGKGALSSRFGLSREWIRQICLERKENA